MIKYRALRHPTDYDVKMKSGSGLQTVKLIDINSKGAQLTGSNGLASGDKIALSVMNTTIAAVVLWSGEGCAGITFRPQISQQVVDRISQCGGARMGHKGRYDSSALQEMR